MTGSGTETDPYQISTADQLKLFRDKVNDAKTEEETKICAVLTSAIDLNNEPGRQSETIPKEIRFTTRAHLTAAATPFPA